MNNCTVTISKKSPLVDELNNIFDGLAIPVTNLKPQRVRVKGRMMVRKRKCYFLDLDRLDSSQLNKVIALVAETNNVSHQTIRSQIVKTGIPLLVKNIIE